MLHSTDKVVSHAFGISVSEAKRLREVGAVAINGEVPGLKIEDRGGVTIRCGKQWKRVDFVFVYDWRSGWSDEELASAIADGSITESESGPLRAAHREWKFQVGAK